MWRASATAVTQGKGHRHGMAMDSNDKPSVALLIGHSLICGVILAGGALSRLAFVVNPIGPVATAAVIDFPLAGLPMVLAGIVYMAYAGKCAGCGSVLRHDDKTMDHIRSDGPGTLENIQLACEVCNNRKRNSQPAEVYLALNFPLVPPAPDSLALQRLIEFL